MESVRSLASWNHGGEMSPTGPPSGPGLGTCMSWRILSEPTQSGAVLWAWGGWVGFLGKSALTWRPQT
eukprot:1155438-Pelagomonas_calceolata.AAC.1